MLENPIDAAHMSCTNRMGAADDPEVVVDDHGRVLGLDGLRVADASIFPWVPSANTHISAVLAARDCRPDPNGGMNRMALPEPTHDEWTHEKELYVRMRDGVHLSTDVILPKEAGENFDRARADAV